MKILLFNDNPVVQKLVALSAQKTKDDLAAASIPEEIDGEHYDLLIVDDALYSDEVFAAIKEASGCKSALLMATRGNAVPAGFDHVINKPFLPTDLVDTLVQIEKYNASLEPVTPPQTPVEEVEAPHYSIDLEETLSALEPEKDFSFEETKLLPEQDELDFDELDAFGEETAQTSILDQEEVREVRDLLEDTESDMALDEELPLESAPGAALEEEEAFDFDMLLEDERPLEGEPGTASGEDEAFDFDMLLEEDERPLESTPGIAPGEEETFDFDMLSEEGKKSPQDAEPFDLEPFDFEEGAQDDAMQKLDTADEVTDPYDFDALGAEEILSDSMEEIETGDLSEGDTFLEEEPFEDLELKIQEAVGALEPDDLDMEIDEEMLVSLKSAPEAQIDDELFDELDLLDERELKLAIGEELEEEPDLFVGEKGRSSIAAEALGEVMGKPVQWNPDEEKAPAGVKSETAAEGVEALQALLKALANEDVAKSLKGLNITININFGKDA